MINFIFSLTFEQAFTPLALFLCVCGSALADKRALGFIYFSNLMFFEVIYYLNLHYSPLYYILALLVDLLVVRIYLNLNATRFLIFFLSISVLYNGLSYLAYEIIDSTFIYIYYNAVMKAIIILSVLSIFIDGCLDAVYRKWNNDSDRRADDIGSFHPRSFRVNKGF